MNSKRIAEAVDELKKFEGLPPHHEANIVAGDGFFYRSIKERFTQEELAAAEKIIATLKQQWRILY